MWPAFYHDIADPLSERWHNFGVGLHPNDGNVLNGPRPNHLWPRMNNFCRALGTMAHPSITKDGFQVCMDVHQFGPDEISVKTVDGVIVVDAKHEDREDEHGYIARQFSRRYTLPIGYDTNEVVSQLSSDGVLTIKAPTPFKTVEDAMVRVVPIQQTGPARLNVGKKENGNLAVLASNSKNDV